MCIRIGACLHRSEQAPERDHCPSSQAPIRRLLYQPLATPGRAQYGCSYEHAVLVSCGGSAEHRAFIFARGARACIEGVAAGRPGSEFEPSNAEVR